VKHVEKSFSIGEKVLVASFTRKVGKVTKFLCKWKGPFSVVEKLGPVNYLLKDERENSRNYGRFKNVSVRHLKSFYTYDTDDSINLISESEKSQVSEVESYFSLRNNFPGEIDRSTNSTLVAPPSDGEINDEIVENEVSEEEIVEQNESVQNIADELSDSNDSRTVRRSCRTRAPPIRYGAYYQH